MAKIDFKKSNLFKAMTKMPPLRHAIPRRLFSLEKSEVVKWLISIPAAQIYLFNRAKDSGAIVYDPDTGTWRGSNYAD